MSPIAGGRPGWPVLGLFPAFRKDPLARLTHTARTAGPLARIPIAGRSYVLVSDPLWIEDILIRNHASFAKVPGLQLPERIMGQGLLTSEGEAWRRQRQIVQPAFRHESLTRYADIVADVAAAHARRWPRRVPVDAARLMAQLAFDIAARTLFGTDMARHAGAVTRALAEVMDDFDRRTQAFLTLPPAWPTPANRAFEHAARRLDAIVDALIDRHRPGQGVDADLITTLLMARDKGQGLARRQVRDQVMTILLAGHETTADALAWCLFLVSRHPNVGDRLAAELSDALGGSRPTRQDLDRLPFTRAIFSEAMRLYPPAWAIGRRAIRPFELDVHRFARGTHVLMSQWVVHRDEAFFPDAGAFRPERWLDGAWAARLPRFAYFPFGGGPRGCIGRDLALMEGPLVLATVLQKVRFALDGPDPEPCPSVTLRMRHGVVMRVTDREPRVASSFRSGAS